MIELVLLALAVFFVVRQLRAANGNPVPAAAAPLVPKPAAPGQKQLADYADRLYHERKWLAAEKAYLKLLKLDHKNVTAYSHLGIIYSTQKNLPDAIECFQIAARLQPGANTYYNLGLAYHENHNDIKAVAAFEKSIMFEPSAPRYIGLSKAYKKLSNAEKSLDALEHAAKLDPSKKVLQLYAIACEDTGRRTEALGVYRQIHELDPSDRVAAQKLGIVLPEGASRA